MSNEQLDEDRLSVTSFTKSEDLLNFYGPGVYYQLFSLISLHVRDVQVLS